ncbi:ABC transporter permease [candidate division WOR-3 bacterium]|nr:ABC transporter permease [candidate division WOR-3 bacterium]
MTGRGGRLGRVALGLVLPLLFLAGWELAAVRLDNPWLLPRVEVVFNRLLHPFADVVETGSLAHNLAVSGLRVLMGFTLAVLVAVPLGLLMGRSPTVRRLVGPLVEMFRPLCPIAWIPFAMAVFKTYTVVNLFGVRYSSTIFDTIQVGMLFILFYGAFFPILLNTIDGVIGVREVYVESAQVLGATRGQLFRKVVLPAAMPEVFTGLRVGLGTAWMVIVAAEMLPGSSSGIGYLIIYAYQLAEMDVLVAGMILIGAVGALLSWGVSLLGRPLVGWQAKAR